MYLYFRMRHRSHNATAAIAAIQEKLGKRRALLCMHRIHAVSSCSRAHTPAHTRAPACSRTVSSAVLPGVGTFSLR
jgi:hypothetical protein